MSRIWILLGVALVAAACTSSGSADTTATLPPEDVSPLSTAPSSSTTVVQTTTSSVPPASQVTPPTYRIVQRTETEAPGDTVVVLLDDSSYESLTDLDIFDIIAEVVELFPPISEVHVVDDAAAANVVGNPDASNEELVAIQANYLARLDNGFTITYLGPFVSSGSAILGS